jgi:iron-sulfur cluster assembly accessory protein
MSFSVSAQAFKRIQELQSQNSSPFFRVRVDPGGCAGFQYAFIFDTQQTPDDFCVTHNGVKVLVDDLSLSFLEGAELDYAQEMIGASFVIHNPNASSSCGCKGSFSPK